MAHHVALSTVNASPWKAETYRDRRLYLTAKRVFDITVAGILLLLLGLPMLAIALLIVLDSPGPPIFRQQRVGLRRRGHGRSRTWEIGTFTFYKFRTMRQNVDSSRHQAFVRALIDNDEAGMAALAGGDREVHKLVDDPRVTRLGKYLRKLSLDELPQFWNVLKGDMSLVGPRPPIPYEVDMYEPWHRQRLEMIPGVTGLWQVSGRCCTGFDEMVKLDLHYRDQQSFWLDLVIILKTPLAVVRGHGAV